MNEPATEILLDEAIAFLQKAGCTNYSQHAAQRIQTGLFAEELRSFVAYESHTTSAPSCTRCRI